MSVNVYAVTVATMSARKKRMELIVAAPLTVTELGTLNVLNIGVDDGEKIKSGTKIEIL